MQNVTKQVKVDIIRGNYGASSRAINFPNTINPDSIRIYRPDFQQRRKKKASGLKKAIAACVWSLMLVGSSIVNYNTFLEPVYVNRIQNHNLKFSPNAYYAPTVNYMTNLNFMGKNILTSVPKKKEKLIKINSKGELEDLKAEIFGITQNYYNLRAGVYVYDYSTGKTVGINQDEVFPAASIIKIPILFDMFNRSKNLEKEGKEGIDVNRKITFQEEHRTSGSGGLQYTNSGVDYTINYLATIMMRNSDNTATNMLLEEIGGINEINASLRHWGFSKTQVSNWLPDLRGENITTPHDIATMLYNIDNGLFLKPEASEKIKDYMSNVKNRGLLNATIPNDATILHKTGDIGKMLGDAGIVYSSSGKKYIVVVMVKRPHNDYGAKDLIQRVSKVVYNYLG